MAPTLAASRQAVALARRRTGHRNRAEFEYQFEVENKGAVVKASYTGILPDTFKDEAEVVLKGRLTASGFEVAPNGVMAKCPSKYEQKPQYDQKVGAGSTTSN